MDVEAALFLRNDVTRLGMAPLTSMFWYGKHDRREATDWRPQVHDSDGLKLRTGSGEHIWRPLINPPERMVSSFVDNGVKGFGLLQRDRDFANYEDPNVHYERRPSLWVEPRGNWGEGAVQLLELPTKGEFNDNIVAYWLPAEPARAGMERNIAYRLHWVADEPYPSGSAAVCATRMGSFGVQDPGSKKFALDWAGGILANMPESPEAAEGIEFVPSAPHGRFDRVHTMRVQGTARWRAIFEYAAEGNDPVDLRGYLRRRGDAISETWLFKFVPSDR
jgi:glucans biosynthesis protein